MSLNCENYFELHCVLEILGLLSKMVFGTGNLDKSEDLPWKPLGLEDFAELRSPRLATSLGEARSGNSGF